MSKVFVVDTNYQPLDPVHPGWARLLLKQGKASVYRRFPFTIILKSVVNQPQVEPLRIKIDPGSKTTGIAVVNDGTGEVAFAASLFHRGSHIKERLDKRRAVRRSRRQRKTRYRAPRIDNRKNKKKGWLPPSVGRVAVRATGSFNITTKQGTIQGIGHRCCTALHKCDGYAYGQGTNPTLSTLRSEDLFPPLNFCQGFPQFESDDGATARGYRFGHTEASCGGD